MGFEPGTSGLWIFYVTRYITSSIDKCVIHSLFQLQPATLVIM